MDSNEPGGPSAAWSPLFGGTSLGDLSGDVTSAEIPLNGGTGAPFQFNFYGKDYDRIRFNENGWIVFPPDSTVPADGDPETYTPSPIPGAQNPNLFFAPLFVDMDVGCGGSFQYLVEGAAPNRVFVLQALDVTLWYDDLLFCGTTLVSFQARLYESSDNLEVVWNYVAYDGESDAGTLVGIEKDGTTGLQYLFADAGGAVALSGMAVRFYPNHGPQAGDDDDAIPGGTTDWPLDVLANDMDPDGDGLRIASVSDPEVGTVRIEGGQLVYSAPADGTCDVTAEFTYVVEEVAPITPLRTDEGAVAVLVACVEPLVIEIVGESAEITTGAWLGVGADVHGGFLEPVCSWDAPGAAILEGSMSCAGISLKYSTPGDYVVRVEAQDVGGDSATDSLAVKAVLPPPSPCPDCLRAAFSFSTDGRSATFRDTSVSTDAPLESWAWDFGDGNTDTTTGPTVSHAFSGFGTYTVTLTVHGATGREASAQRLVGLQTATAYSAPVPVADAGPDQDVRSGERVVLDGLGADGTRAASFRWAQVSGPSVVADGLDTARPTFVAPDVPAGQSADLAFELVIYDGRFESVADRVTLTVRPANAPPRADAGSDRQVPEGADVTLDARGSLDPDGDALVVTWTQVRGPRVALRAEGALAQFQAPLVSTNPGMDLDFLVNVTDGVATAQDLVRIRVANHNQPPIPVFTAEASLDRPGEFSFSDASQDAEGIAVREWGFGDGTPLVVEENPTHVYRRSGDYLVVLTVTDDAGAVRSFQSVMQVRLPESAETQGGPVGDGEDAPAAGLLAALGALAVAAARRRR